MIDQQDLKNKLEEAMKLLEQSSGDMSNIKSGNLESLIQAMSGNGESELLEGISSLHSVLESINQQALDMMKNSNFKVVKSRYAEKPRKVRKDKP